MKQLEVFAANYSLGKPILFALVDDVDFDFLCKFNWTYQKHVLSKTYYAYTTIDRKLVYMHSLILPPLSRDFETDHKNGNGLDNQRENLRLATHSQNCANRGMRTDNKSGYKGVSWSQATQNWKAELGVKGVRKYLGCFKTKEAAARAYNTAAFEAFGEFAKLNEFE